MVERAADFAGSRPSSLAIAKMRAHWDLNSSGVTLFGHPAIGILLRPGAVLFRLQAKALAPSFQVMTSRLLAIQIGNAILHRARLDCHAFEFIKSPFVRRFLFVEKFSK